MNNTAKTTFFFFALTGWVAGLIVHLTAAVADYALTEKFAALWLLHVGVFIVWIPTILVIRNNPELSNLKKWPISFSFFGRLIKDVPGWVKLIAAAGFFYAIFNFLFCMISIHGTPDIINGQYVLQNHGTFVRNITFREYEHYQALQCRAFSGHWIAFYGIACAVLYPFRKQPEITTG